ncbi:DUF5906 domain-containing protein [Cyanothece sp. BG0011]|uniref:DUF5906 domain-containing protein n=1 Tax=Cyanothece sp. BG0011 TaxID=2082950 RepID=UPI000D1EF253|nr:DUF5906 domain-containing protein [Cyanothece sp. BG0011]
MLSNSVSHHNYYGNTSVASLSHHISRLTRSGKSNPCPICDRTKDADCCFNDEVVFCHSFVDVDAQKLGYVYRGSHENGIWGQYFPQSDWPPSSYKPSKRITSKKSSKANSSNLSNPSKSLSQDSFKAIATLPQPLRRETSIPKAIKKPSKVPNQAITTVYPYGLCDHSCLPNLEDVLESTDWLGYGYVVRYDWVKEILSHSIDDNTYKNIYELTQNVPKDNRQKTFRQWHTSEQREVINGKGNHFWLPYQFYLINRYGKGKTLIISEGEETVHALGDLGILATTWQGSNWTEKTLHPSVELLKAIGIKSLVFITDNDEEGDKKAKKVLQVTRNLDIPCATLPINKLWLECPKKGDIADYLREHKSMNQDDFIRKLEEQIHYSTALKEQDDLLSNLEVESNIRGIEVNVNNDDQISWVEQAFSDFFDDDYWITVTGIMHKWNGKYYEPVEDVLLESQVSHYLRENMPKKATPTNLNNLIKWAKMITGVLPNQVNTSGINLSNGILEIEWKGKQPSPVLVAHSPSRLYTYCSDAKYKPDADDTDCNKLLEVLDPDQRDIFLKLIGASLDLNTVRKYQGRNIRATLLLGEGSNGKDALREVVKSMFGNTGMTSCTLMDFKQYDTGRKFPLSILGTNPKINWSSENTDSVKLDHIQSLKQAITGDSIDVERKGQDGVSLNPSCLFIFNVNKPLSWEGN